ncbi:MAG TPA: NAD(P)/FAD-dependent oxidoreductase [Longimicrobiales bacterium]|nr:NAD(P)/FAD-dependent oxidoreductase [Longimicrobiales bacterium]
MSGDDVDVVVVGGSWAGLAAALQLGRARTRTLIVDAGRPRNRFARASHGFLGQDGRSPEAILETFREQVLAYATVRLREELAVDISTIDHGGFAVELASGSVLRAARLILATGVVDELPAIQGLRERWGKTVLHCPYCHGYEVADARLGVLATSDAAMHLALLLPDWSADVTLFTNGAFDPHAEQRAQLMARGVKLETRPLQSLLGDAPALDGIQLEGGDIVPVDALFSASRTRMAAPFAERLGCAFNEGPLGPVIRTDERKETSVPNVFAAGDAARVPYSGTFAAADGAMAGISAHQSLALAAAP